VAIRRRVKPYRCGYPCDHLIDPASPPPLDTCSYGGGHQSTALLVLARRGVIPTRTFLFCNVGDDSEHPGTLEYVRTVAQPYADHHGIDLQTLTRQKRDGTTETLMGRLMREDSRSLPIPVRMSNGAPGNRSCTADFKIRVVGRWLKHHGATAENPAQVSIGISLDEIARANTSVKDDWERVIYPLVGIGTETGLKMRRVDCDRLIQSEPLPPEVAVQVKQAVADGLLTVPAVVSQLERSGYTTLPIPPKSSCFFCPFHRPAAWADLARERPDLFERSAELEETLNVRRATRGKDPVFLTRFAIPLRDAIDTDQETLPGMDESDAQCDSGYCWT
jgi:hypothetical protein